jgi:hypothetical protein
MIALPARAGQAYIPFVASDPPGFDSGRSTTPSLYLYNLGSVARRYSVRFVPAGAIGLEGGELVQADILAPQTFVTVSCCSRQSGVLVVSGAPQIAVSAELFEIIDRPSHAILTRLPVFTARDALPAHGSALLQAIGWTANGLLTSSLGILNFGSHPAHCSVGGFVDEPERFSDLRNLVVAANSTTALADVIGQRIASLGTFASYSARPTVTCDQPFYPFAINYEGGSLPDIEVVLPAVVLGNAP